MNWIAGTLDDIKNIETKSNALFAENDLIKCLYYYNSDELRKMDIQNDRNIY